MQPSTTPEIAKMRAQLKKDWHEHPELDWCQKSGRNLGGLNLTASRGADETSFCDSRSMTNMVVTGLVSKGATLDVTLGRNKFVVTGDRAVKPPVFLKPGDPIHAIVLAKGGEPIAVRFSIHGYEMTPDRVYIAKQLVKEMSAA